MASINRVTAVVAVCLLVAAVSMPVYGGEDQNGYYQDSHKGWWWGEREKPKKKKKKEEPKPQVQAQQQEPFIPPPLKDYKYADVWNMHPDDFYELQDAYKKKAVQYPTEANVKDYYEMQEIARKKSLEFTNASEYIWQKYPQLSVAADYPITNPGNQARKENIEEEKAKVLAENRDKYAVIFFWKPGCSYCEEQRKILKWFETNTGWIVRPVNIYENPQLAKKVGVTVTPTMILIKKGSQDYFPVSAGVMSYPDLQDKTYRAVRLLNGDVSPQEYSIYDFQKGGGFDVNGRKDWVK